MQNHYVTQNDVAAAHQSTTKIDLIMTSARPSRADDSRTWLHVTRLDQSRFELPAKRHHDWSTSRT